jgi:hypothetical protein
MVMQVISFIKSISHALPVHIPIFRYKNDILISSNQRSFILPFAKFVHVEYLFELHHYSITQHVLNLGYNLS